MGIKRAYKEKCLDHTSEQVSEGLIKLYKDINKVLAKVCSLIKSLREHPAKQLLQNIIKEQGQDPFTIRVGTENRRFFKYQEVKCVESQTVPQIRT